MSVSAIGSMSGNSSYNTAITELHRAQQKLNTDQATKAAAPKVVDQDRDAVARAQEAADTAKAAAAAQQTQTQQMLPAGQTPQQQSKPVTASNSKIGGSFDVKV